MVSDAPAHLLNSDEGTFCLSGLCPGFRVKASLKPKTRFEVKEGFHVGLGEVKCQGFDSFGFGHVGL